MRGLIRRLDKAEGEEMRSPRAAINTDCFVGVMARLWPNNRRQKLVPCVDRFRLLLARYARLSVLTICPSPLSVYVRTKADGEDLTWGLRDLLGPDGPGVTRLAGANFVRTN